MSLMTSNLGISVDHQLVWDSGYELIELWSSGTHCDVWQVRHRSTYELFAWKQLRPEWELHPTAWAGLENEAAVGQLVSSPLLERLVQSHVHETPRYLIREWFEGRTLEQLLREHGRFPTRQALWTVRQCAQGLDDLLHAGLTHGDVQAAHILVNPRSGLIKLTELASSRRVPRSASLESLPRGSGPMGDYDTVVSPPQSQGPARDLYQLGLILFRALAGRPPFQAETAADMVRGPHASVAEDLRRARPDLTTGVINVINDLLSMHAERPITHPATLVNRLMELELSELLHMELPRQR